MTRKRNIIIKGKRRGNTYIRGYEIKGKRVGLNGRSRKIRGKGRE